MTPLARNFLRIFLAGLSLWSIYCLYYVAANLWQHFRLREVQVRTLRSSLEIDARGFTPGDPAYPDYHLHLDFITTDGTNRSIHWEDWPGRAAYPEEALDELQRWAPGTIHTIRLVRGEARSFRLPGGAPSPELNSALSYTIGALFLATLAGVTALFVSTGRPSLSGVWVIFFGFGVLSLFGAAAFATSRITKVLTWPRVRATFHDTPAVALPPNVTITPKARELLDARSYRVLTIPYQGTEIHAGIGPWEGPYDILACAASCAFWIDPHDRWGVDDAVGWNKFLFLPLSVLLLFGLAFTKVGLVLRRTLQD